MKKAAPACWFEVAYSDEGHHWLRLKARNSEIVLSSENYATKAVAFREARKWSKRTGIPLEVEPVADKQ